MSLTKHAIKELTLAKLFDKDSVYGGMVGEAVRELIEVFSRQGHSGASASMIRQIFNILAAFKPLTSLTGNDDEWTEVGNGVFQNNRCSTIFKQADRFEGKPYNIEGKVFSDDGGNSWYTGKGSCTMVEFPYIPKEPEELMLNIKKEEK